MKGLITKLTGGLYTVTANDKGYDCRARGKFRHDNVSPKVGDTVEFSETDHYILSIDERINNLDRPPICNVDQAIVAFSSKEPIFNYSLLDRLLCIIEFNNITPIIVVTKMDLLDEKETKELTDNLLYYKKYYQVIYTSSKSRSGVESVENIFKDKITVISGQSGVGKSSLINALDSRFNIETNEISHALGRGKHTTRHTELLKLHGGLVADTPGFSKIDFSGMELRDLEQCFIDFFELGHECKYKNCFHINEPKCRVKEELEKGNIPDSRYNSYLQFYKEIKDRKKLY